MKKAFLLDIETQTSSRWEDANYHKSELISDKPKFFATFPFPYMNGKIHLGHGFTACKVDFTCRFKRLQGYNVLFPFGFHCTGMPICAAAKKLEIELNTIEDIKSDINEKLQYNILKCYELTHDEICEFVNPNKWVTYFTNEGIKDVKAFNMMTDLSRSFVTTDLNTFYDSFIRYQFTKLHNLGLLKYGTRNSVYSKILDIQCQDHDRSIGEGVGIDEYKIKTINSIDDENIKFILVIKQSYLDKNADTNVTILLSSNSKFLKFKHNSILYYCSEYLYLNMIEQDMLELGENYHKIIQEEILSTEIENLFKNIKCADRINPSESIKLCSFNSKEIIEVFKFCVKQTIDVNVTSAFSNKSIYLLEDVVKDRTGNYCIVKPLPQWYINYADPEWKETTIKLVETCSESSPDVTKTLINNINKLMEWGVSRQFGLGTRLPCDEKELIDSLSDSTIYPAYYTISNIIQSNVFGESIDDIKAKDFTFEVWDYIFMNSELEPDLSHDSTIDINLINKMRESFNYWYPVDLRISGKDLITNHLVMYLFNHAVCFKEKYFPKKIFANGWIMIDGVKMSKSNGNFITVQQLMGKIPIDSIRMTLADCGDDINDANFVKTNMEDNNLLKIYDWTEHLKTLYTEENKINYRKDDLKTIDQIYLNLIDKQIDLTIQNYDDLRFRDVLINMFYTFNALREKYRIHCKLLELKLHIDIVDKFLYNQTILINPIIPHTSEYVWKNILNKRELIYNSEIDIRQDVYSNELVIDWENICDLIQKIQLSVTKNKKKKNWKLNKITIKYNFKFDDHEFVDFVKNLTEKTFDCNVEFDVQDREKYYFVLD